MRQTLWYFLLVNQFKTLISELNREQIKKKMFLRNLLTPRSRSREDANQDLYGDEPIDETLNPPQPLSNSSFHSRLENESVSSTTQPTISTEVVENQQPPTTSPRFSPNSSTVSPISPRRNALFPFGSRKSQALPSNILSSSNSLISSSGNLVSVGSNIKAKSSSQSSEDLSMVVGPIQLMKQPYIIVHLKAGEELIPCDKVGYYLF